jgi:hypothetical protein
VTQERPTYEQIIASIDELAIVSTALKKENIRLKKQVVELQSHLSSIHNYADLGTGNLNDNERIALRNQIQSYIKRIDTLLEESA